MNKGLFTVLSCAAVSFIGLTGCGSSSNESSGCSISEPTWTADVAPMVTRGDGGEAAALVWASEYVASGEILNDVFSSNKKVENNSAENTLNILTSLLTPKLSAEGISSDVKKPKTDMNPIMPEGPQDCSAGGTKTITYVEKEVDGGRHDTLTYSFDNCDVNDTDELLDIVSNLGGFLSKETSALDETDTFVTLNGELGAEYKNFSGTENGVPSWMGPPSWYTGISEGAPESMYTDYDRRVITASNFTAVLPMKGDSIKLAADISLSSEMRYIEENDVPSNIPSFDGPGFYSDGSYYIGSADGCLKADITTEGETLEIFKIGAVDLEVVTYDDKGSKDPDSEGEESAIQLNGYVEASISTEEEPSVLSLKADGFYRYYNDVGIDQRAVYTIDTIMVGMLGSSCLEGMLFINGDFIDNFADSDDTLPADGSIYFFASAPEDGMQITGGVPPLASIEFMSPEGGVWMPTYGASLSIGGQLIDTYPTWSALIGENACTGMIDDLPL